MTSSLAETQGNGETVTRRTAINLCILAIPAEDRPRSDTRSAPSAATDTRSQIRLRTVTNLISYNLRNLVRRHCWLV
jgi:hypothetical protein